MALVTVWLQPKIKTLRTIAIRLIAIGAAAAALLMLGPVDIGRAQSTQTQQQGTVLGPAALQALVAPIALYPDPLLAQVLMASTYPLEIVQAERWLKENEHLKGDTLKEAADKAGWDQSVASLVATPSVLAMMSSKLDWTQKLGDAVLAQQSDVMEAVQALRAKAYTNEKLTSGKEQKVVVNNDGGKRLIAIEPTAPETVYVPYYDPAVVYGAWPYSDYPAYYFPPPAYVPGAVLATGLAFGAGYALGRWTSGANYWGGGINWNNNNINVNRPRVNPLGGGAWAHNPAHRRGVQYGNASVQQRFGANGARSNVQNRPGSQGGAGQRALSSTNGRGGGTRKAANANRPTQHAKKSAGKPRQSASQGARNKAQKTARHTPKAGAANRSAATRHHNATRAASGRHPGMQSHRAMGSMASARVGGAPRMHAGRGGGGRGGGRRSDIRLKHDIILLGYMTNGIGLYRFTYNGGHTSYVGVLAQQVRDVAPSAVVRGRDGYLRVRYQDIGVRFQTYRHWVTTQGGGRDGMACRLTNCTLEP